MRRERTALSLTFLCFGSEPRWRLTVVVSQAQENRWYVGYHIPLPSPLLQGGAMLLSSPAGYEIYPQNIMCNSSPGSCNILAMVLVSLSLQSFSHIPPQGFIVTFNLIDICPSKRRKVHCKSESQLHAFIISKVMISPSPGLILQEAGLLLQTRGGKSTLRFLGSSQCQVGLDTPN